MRHISPTGQPLRAGRSRSGGHRRGGRRGRTSLALATAFAVLASTLVIGLNPQPAAAGVAPSLQHEFFGTYDFTGTGATLRTASNSVDACAITTSATSGDLTLPAGATVESAILYWAGSHSPAGSGPGSTPDGSVTLNGQSVAATPITETFTFSGTDYDWFSVSADVTSIVSPQAAGSTVTYSVDDFDVWAGAPHCSVSGVLGAWSLVVVYEDPSLIVKQLNIYEGFQANQNSTIPFAISGFVVPPVFSDADVAVLAWEGDPDLSGGGEETTFGGTANTPGQVVLSDASNPLGNPYNSVSNLFTGNSYSIDFDSYDVSSYLSPGDTSATMEVGSGSDLILLNTIVMAIPSLAVDISLDKTVSPTTASIGDTVTFSVVAANAGPDDAISLVVTDQLPSGYTYVSDNAGGAYDPATGEWTLSALPAGSSATLEITATVRAGDHENIAEVTSSVPRDLDSEPANGDATEDDYSSATVTLANYVDLAVAKTVDDPAPTQGSTVAYTVTVSNEGDTAATGVELTDVLPGGLQFVSAAPSTGSYDPATGVWTVGSIGAGTSATLGITADVTGSGTITNTVAVAAVDQADIDATNDTASIDINATVPDLSAIKSADVTGPVSAGDVITYTIEITNSGTADQTDIEVDDALPPGTAYVAESTSVAGFDLQTGPASTGASTTSSATIANACTSPITRFLTVPDAVTISDVNLGFNATHVWRSDIRVELTSPAGTTVRLMNGDQGDSLDNYDVLLDDESSTPLNDGTNDTVASPYYDRGGVPDSPLSAFDGQNAAGTWTLTVCDTYPSSDDGTFNRAELFISGTATGAVPTTLDNIPGGPVGDLASGTPPSMVTAADGLDLAPGDAMTVTYQVQVASALDASFDRVVNTVQVTSNEQPSPSQSTNRLDIDFQPVINIDKAGPAGPLAVGDLATYTFTVAHGAGSDLSPAAVAIDDDILGPVTNLVSGDSDGDGLLDAGETWILEETFTVPADAADPLVNTAILTGTDANGDALAPTQDQHSMDIEHQPLLSVTKVGSPSTASLGDVVTYTYTVQHAGGSDGSAVSSVAVVDSRGLTLTGPAGDTDGDGALDAGEVWTYTGTETVTIATPDPLTNDVTVDGADRDGDAIPQANASESVDIDFAPQLQVEKSGPASAAVGDTVTYTFMVSHAPASDGSGASVTAVVDDVAGAAAYTSGDDNSNGLLDAAETWTYEATYTVAASDPNPLVNQVTVTATDLDGDAISEPTDTHETAVDYVPAVAVVKSGPATASVGDTVTYTFAVTHDAASDGSDITAITISDDITATPVYVSGDDGDSVLELGETWIYEAAYTVSAGDPSSLVNTATVTGVDLNGDTTSDTDSHTTSIEHQPALSVTKSGPAIAAVGDTVTYTFAVTHDAASDGSDITTITVSDDIAGAATFVSDDGDGDSVLELGETWTYEATYTIQPSDPDPLVNTATAIGTDPDGDTVTDSDTHSTNVLYSPVLEVVKSGPATAAVGDTVTYTFAVTHGAGSDGSDITTVTVSDDIAGVATYVAGDTDGGGVLTPDETWIFEAAYTIQPTDPDALVNTVAAAGIDPEGDTVGDSDDHTTDVEFDPTLAATKTGPATAEVGDTVTYTFTVAHDPASDGSPVTVASVGDDVAGPATYLSGDDGDGLLEFGETWSYEATYTVQSADPNVLTNTVTVTGTDADGDTIGATDTHVTDVEHIPVIAATKTGPVSAVVGEAVTYQIAVTHDAASDGSPVGSLTVDDDVAGSATYVAGDDGDGLLEPGETWNYTVDYTIQPTDPDPLVNTATATGTDPDGDTVSDSDTHSTDIGYSPDIEIIKSGPASAAVGDTVTYSFNVAHSLSSDGSPVASLGVSDDIAGSAAYVSGDDGDGLLEPGETWNYTVDYTIQPTDPDPLVNTATATGTDPDGDTVTDSDTHSTNIGYSPLIAIAKSGPASAPVGSTVTFTFDVSHDAASDGSPISGVSVLDDIAGAATYLSGDDGDGLLEAGETWSFTRSYTIAPDDPDTLINTATTTGTGPSGSTVTASDSHTTDIAFDPVLRVIKSATVSAAVGDTVTYTFAVSHGLSSDGSPMTITSVNDDIAGLGTYQSGDDGDGVLEQGETWVYTAQYTLQPSDPATVTNTVTAEAIDPDGDLISASDTHDLDVAFSPALDIVKSAAATATVGDTVTYTFEVSHGSGSDGSPIAGVAVSDDVTGLASYASGDDGDGLLEAGETWQFTDTRAVEVTDSDPLINTATATGSATDGASVSATDTHSLDIEFAPVLAVQKTAVATASPDQDVTYTITVAHDASSDGSAVSGLVVSDDLTTAPTLISGDDGDGLLEQGETWVYQVTRTVQTTDPSPLINTASAAGIDRDGDPVSGSDSHSLTVEYSSALRVTKSGPATAAVGDNVVYSFVVDHHPDSDGSLIESITVVDDIAGPAVLVGGDTDGDGALDPGESWLYEANYTIAPDDANTLTNTVTAQGTDPVGASLSAQDSHSTDVEYNPVLQMTKTGPAGAAVGSTVTYTFEVSHAPASDGSDLILLTVTDDVIGATTYVSGDADADGRVDAGETWVFEADYTIRPDDPNILTNVGTAAAVDRDGETISTTDSHDTDVAFSPVLAVSKSGPAGAGVGDTVGYSFAVTHAAGSDLSPVAITSVTDNVAGSATYSSGDDGDGLLEAGETWVYTATYAIQLDDPDMLINTVTVDGTDPEGDAVTAVDSHTLDVEYSPVLTVAKSGPTSAAVGETVTYSFEVQHDATSDGSPVSLLTVTDDIAGPAVYDSGDDGDGYLQNGESWLFTATYLVPADAPDSLTNIATASGQDGDGDVRTATDTHTLDVEFAPEIAVTKSGPTAADTGETITYNFAVTHAAGSDRSPVLGVTVDDDVAGATDFVSGDANGNGDLDFGETWQFAVGYTVSTLDPDPLVNTATARGTDRDGDAVSATDTHSLDVAYNPVVEVTKSGPASASPGSTVTYTFEVAHAASSDGSPVASVSILDDVAGTPTFQAGDDGDAILEAGETWSYAVTYAVTGTDPDPLVNTVTVTGVDLEGETVTASDSHTTDITFTPTLQVVKSAQATATVGEVVAYVFEVSHGPGSDLSPIANVAVTDDIVGTTTYTSGDDGDSLLEPGETWTFTATWSVTAESADPLVNTATATGAARDGAVISDTDTHSLDVDFAPTLDITKTGPATAAIGDSVTYTFQIEHAAGSDGSPVSGVVLTDDQTSPPVLQSGDDGDGLLEAGETWVYSVDYTLDGSEPDPFVNTAAVAGTDRDGDSVTAGDSHVLDPVFAPVIDVQKNGPSSADVGEVVIYTFDVSHAPASDGSPVSVATVTDDIAGPAAYVAGDDGDGLLEGGETWTYEATYTIQATDPNPLVNTVTVAATDPEGDAIGATDSHTTGVVFNAALEVVKSGPSTGAVGETISYGFALSHAPASDGTPVTVSSITDDIAGAAAYVGGDDGDGLLEGGETWTYEATYTIQATDPDPLVNTVTVAAQDAIGDPLSATDSHSLDVGFSPVMSVVKTGPASAVIGDDVLFTFVIEHAPTSDGSPVAITSVDDDVAGAGAYVGGDDGDGLLESGETWTYETTYTIQAVDPDPLVNTVTVTGTDTEGDVLTATDSHSLDVLNGGIDIQKTAGTAKVVSGEDVTFTITVTNTGDTQLTNVTITDPQVPACDTTYPTLAIGASQTHTCTATTVGADFTNTATVTAQDPLNNQITDTDTATVDVIAPAITIQKTADNPTILTGDDVTFTITVTNTGDTQLTNVTITDPQVPACDTTYPTLAIGASQTHTCTATTVGADFTNTATVTAQDPLNNQITDTDTATVDVIAPAITIQKTADNPTILTGDDVTFTITVTNTGDTQLTNVTITDPQVPVCDTTIATLPAGDAATVTCTVTGVTADFTNTADVTADHAAGGSLTETDTAGVDVISPSMAVSKTPDTQNVIIGGTANFTISVANTGDTELTSVTVTDANAPGCDTTIATLPAGDTISTACTVTGVTADFTNTADVTADHAAGGSLTGTDTADVAVLVPGVEIQKSPTIQTVVDGGTATFTITVTNTSAVDLTGVAVTDPLAPDCDLAIGNLAAGSSTTYSCDESGLTADFTNTASVTGTDPLGSTVGDSDTAEVNVIAPAMTIDKTPDTQSVVSGGTANFTISVANTGDTELTNVTITDANAPGCDTTIATLPAGDAATVTCTVTGVTADFTNTASVSAEDPLSNVLTGTDTADVVVLVPGVEIQKTPNLQTVGYGSTVTFTIAVTNTGDAPLSNLSVTDPLAPGCDTTIATLAVGATQSYTCTLADVIADMTNTASVTAEDATGTTWSDSDTAVVDVITPVIDIEKTPDLQTVVSGDDVTFTITLTNTGDVTLSNVTVVDPIAPACNTSIPSMAPGAVQSYTCTLTSVTTDLTNVASASASDPLGRPLTDSDSAEVEVIAPGVEIEKTPDTQIILSGGDASFTITVTNTGDTDLTDVEVVDPAVPACNATIGDLAMGQSVTHTCVAVGVTSDFTNIAGVVGTDPLTNEVSDADAAAVDVIAPGLAVAKNPSAQSVIAGGTASFTIEVANTGDVELTNLVVDDPNAPGCDLVAPTLAAGATVTVTCAVADVTAGFTNTADVTALDPLMNTLAASDSAEVSVLVPAVDIQKTPDIQTVLQGDTANFTITVTNTGATDLVNVTVSDPIEPSCDATVGALAPGESSAIACSTVGTVDDFTNTAIVEAQDPLGGRLSGSDSVEVDVIAPGLEISKTPDDQVVYLGADAFFSIEVANTGDVTLSNVTVTDAAAPACDTVLPTLAAGASVTISCSAPSVTSDFTNTAVATATGPLGNIVSDSDTADVAVLLADVDIQKSPDLQTVTEGDTATFTITVTNSGATALSNLSVSDALVPACDRVIATLAIAESTTFSCSITAGSSFINTASVTADDPVGNPVSDSDSADLIVVPTGTVRRSRVHRQRRRRHTGRRRAEPRRRRRGRHARRRFHVGCDDRCWRRLDRSGSGGWDHLNRCRRVRS